MGDNKREVPLKLNIAYGIGEISDSIAYQGFSFLIFTFYFTVVGLDVNVISAVFIIWSIYNALNDPLLGAISDKTRTKKFGGGRRKPWIVAMTLPLALIMIFLFTPPMNDKQAAGIYFLIIICLFDTIYTASAINNTALYPEMFQTDKARAEVGVGRRSLMVVGLIIAYVLPGLFIPDMTNKHNDPATLGQYQLTGAVFGILILVISIFHIKYGIKEPPLDEIKSTESMGFFESLKICMVNKKFIIFCCASIMNWYVFGLLPMIVPLYATYVLGIDSESIKISILLLMAFLMSIPGVFIWSKVDEKLGSKKSFIISTIVWIVSLIPLAFTRDYNVALVIMCFVGLGLGGSPFFIDKNISNIIDEDQLITGHRREAAYYGVHALIIRLSTIMCILSISFVLSTNGWQTYVEDATDPGLIPGLQSLVSWFPAGALAISLIFLALFPLNKARVDEIMEKKLAMENQPREPQE